MPAVQYDPSISLGIILQIVSIIAVGCTVGIALIKLTRYFDQKFNSIALQFGEVNTSIQLAKQENEMQNQQLVKINDRLEMQTEIMVKFYSFEERQQRTEARLDTMESRLQRAVDEIGQSILGRAISQHARRARGEE